MHGTGAWEQTQGIGWREGEKGGAHPVHANASAPEGCEPGQPCIFVDNHSGIEFVHNAIRS